MKAVIVRHKMEVPHDFYLSPPSSTHLLRATAPLLCSTPCTCVDRKKQSCSCAVRNTKMRMSHRSTCVIPGSLSLPGQHGGRLTVLRDS